MIAIAWDSPDKNAKDTLIKEFHKSTNFQYPCINRWTGTSYSYGKFWKRDLNFEEYFDYCFFFFSYQQFCFISLKNFTYIKHIVIHLFIYYWRCKL